MQPKVSIIIPCYNGLKYLPETLDSIQQQSYKKLEVIVIDDGSTDGSFEYLQSLNHNNLILKKNKGKGACSARNYGIEISSGDYIQFLDADDLLSRDKIKNQIELLKSNSECIAVCCTKHFYDSPENGSVTDQDFLYTTNDPSQFLLNLLGSNGMDHNMVGQHAWLIPHQIIQEAGGWNESLFKDQDGEYFTRVVMKSQGIIFTEADVAFYRKHIEGTNIANSRQRKHLESQYLALQSKVIQLKSVKDTEAYNKAMALQFKFIAIDAWPQFKDISHKALMQSKNYGNSAYLPVLGGTCIEAIKKMFGWRIAKSLRYWLHNSDIVQKLRV